MRVVITVLYSSLNSRWKPVCKNTPDRPGVMCEVGGGGGGGVQSPHTCPVLLGSESPHLLGAEVQPDVELVPCAVRLLHVPQ